MERAIRFAICLIIITLMAAPAASAATYYIAANGSDSNSGTSKSAPWLRAPGMTGCSSNCASYTPQAGDQFIFRGGDTWHIASGSPIGLPWTFSWSGSSGNPIYIGVDQTWYSGGSWVRPIINGDNPLSTTQPSGCTYAQDGTNFITISGSYVTFDNFEFTGKCWSGGGGGDSLRRTGTSSITSNCYFHGWTMATSATSDTQAMMGGSGAGTGLITGNVFDGSDSSLGTAQPTDPNPRGTGAAIFQGDCYEISKNVFRHVSNGAVCSPVKVHDNLFEYVLEPLNDSPHGNVVEDITSAGSSTPVYFYNNIVRYTSAGVGIWMTSNTYYIFNNVLYGSTGSSGTANAFIITPYGGGNPAQSTATIYFYNNTVDSASSVRYFAGNSNNTGCGPCTAYYENNHFIGYSTASLSSTYGIDGGAIANITDNGHEVFQTESVANGQGYVPGNSYAPTSGTSATVGAGLNATSSCSAFSTDLALCSATGGGAARVSGSGGEVASYPAITINARPSTGAWDAGAYQLASSPAPPKPSPPTGLAATVQ